MGVDGNSEGLFPRELILMPRELIVILRELLVILRELILMPTEKIYLPSPHLIIVWDAVICFNFCVILAPLMIFCHG